MSYIGISLSHPFVSKLDIEIQNFCKSKDNFLKNESITKNSINGIFSGFYAYHPITKEKIDLGKKLFFDAPAMPGMGFLQKVN